MVYGPINGKSGGQSGRAGADPFSFGKDAMMLQGFGAIALMWTAPWRAACIVADEMVRETIGRPR